MGLVFGVQGLAPTWNAGTPSYLKAVGMIIASSYKLSARLLGLCGVEGFEMVCEASVPAEVDESCNPLNNLLILLMGEILRHLGYPI